MRQKIKTLALSIPRAKIAFFTVLFLLIALIPALTHTQWFTGPLVNGILILTYFNLGTGAALTMGLFPSSMALLSGTLPLVLAPMVPFITISNAIFVFVFAGLQKQNKFWALIAAAICKTVFLWATASFLMDSLLTDALIAKMTVMMTWPQFWTAMLGGALALGIYQKFQK